MKTNFQKLKIFIVILVTIISTLLIDFFIFKGRTIQNKTQIIKEMTQSENETNLQAQINQLNKSHKDYSTNVQAYKKQIAEAITNQGVSTSENATAEVISDNISKILQTRTSNATATAANITEGMTAYVNGQLIIGTGTDNKSNYENGYNDGSSQTSSIVQPSIVFSGNYYFDNNWYSISTTLSYNSTNKVWTCNMGNFSYTTENNIITSWRTTGKDYHSSTETWYDYDIEWKYVDGKWSSDDCGSHSVTASMITIPLYL